MLFFKKTPKQTGMILVITLMITSVLLSIAVGFGVFIISDLRQARQIDNAIMAYYAADAGIEQSLFLIRKNEDIEDSTGVKEVQDREVWSGLNWGWNISSSEDHEKMVLRQRIAAGESFKLYFLDRSTLNNAIKVQWQKNDNRPNTKLQMIFTQLDLQSKNVSGADILINYADQNLVENFDSSPSYQECKEFLDKELPDNSGGLPPYDYVVEFKALGSSFDVIDRIIVEGYDTMADCRSVDDQKRNDSAITNITFKSEGRYLNARQEIVAHIPPRDPLTGLLSFVLFSEKEITKSY